MTRERDIIHENGKYWVWRKNTGWYEVFKNVGTYSLRCATVSFGNDDERARNRAIEECDRRASQ